MIGTNECDNMSANEDLACPEFSSKIAILTPLSSNSKSYETLLYAANNHATVE